MERLMKDFLNEDDTGVIAYGYIDEEAGMSFQIAKLASLKDNELNIRDSIDRTMMIVRFGSLQNARYLDLSQVDMDLAQFDDFEKMIRESYDTDNEAKEQIRTMSFLDECRHPDYPDDLAVFLLRGDNQPERVWVRGNYLGDHEIRGELLNEPNADFAVHYGDSVQIIPYKQDDGSIICVSPQCD